MKITLCGSTKFKDQFNDWNQRLSKMGHIVYSVASFGHSGDTLTADEKEALDLVHLRKVIESDAIFVVGLRNLDPVMPASTPRELYIGDSTRREIAWARMWDKMVFGASDRHTVGYTLLEDTSDRDGIL